MRLLSELVKTGVAQLPEEAVDQAVWAAVVMGVRYACLHTLPEWEAAGTAVFLPFSRRLRIRICLAILHLLRDWLYSEDL